MLDWHGPAGEVARVAQGRSNARDGRTGFALCRADRRGLAVTGLVWAWTGSLGIARRERGKVGTGPAGMVANAMDGRLMRWRGDSRMGSQGGALVASLDAAGLACIARATLGKARPERLGLSAWCWSALDRLDRFRSAGPRQDGPDSDGGSMLRQARTGPATQARLRCSRAGSHRHGEHCQRAASDGRRVVGQARTGPTLRCADWTGWHGPASPCGALRAEARQGRHGRRGAAREGKERIGVAGEAVGRTQPVCTQAVCK